MLSRISLSSRSTVIPKSQFLTKSNCTNRSLHSVYRDRKIFVQSTLNFKIRLGKSSIRHASIIKIPEAPTMIDENISEFGNDGSSTPQILTENISELTSAGLGTSFTPVSLVQHILEFLHASVGLPWWVSIITVTVVARSACFPLIISGQKRMAEMSAYMPGFMKVQQKYTEARRTGDTEEVKRCAQEMDRLIKGKEFDSIKSLYPMLGQGSVALTIFLSLNKMSAAPVISMQEGGLWWFSNLCVPDPHLILPCMSSTTLMLLMYSTSKQMPIPNGMKRTLITVLPVVTFFCVKSFPAGTLVYWITTNSITLFQHEILKLPKVRNYFNLPDVPKSDLANQFSGNFLDNLKQNWNNAKVTQELRERAVLSRMEKAQLNQSKEVKKYNTKKRTPVIEVLPKKK